MAIKDVILGYAKGDKGDRGPQGEKGATGATGPKGEPGNIADAQITDTEGLDVAKGQKTTAQKLFDAIANRIVTKLVTNDALTKKLADYMLKGMMSNTNVNNTGTVPTSALMYSMFEQINSDMSKFDVYHRDVTGSLNDDKIIQTALEDFKTSIVTNKPILVEIQNHLGGRALAVGIQSLSNYNSFLVITYYDRPKEFVYALNHWEVYELVTKSDLALQTQTLYKNVVIYRIGNIAMLSAPSWVRKEELAGVTIPTGYRPVKTISITFTQQNFNDGAYCDVSTEGKINYTGTSPIVINAIWFCT